MENLAVKLLEAVGEIPDTIGENAVAAAEKPKRNEERRINLHGIPLVDLLPDSASYAGQSGLVQSHFNAIFTPSATILITPRSHDARSW
ncbi:MAG: hypothetical protein AB9869_09110 [Verrucomicrobiia bacterium]